MVTKYVLLAQSSRTGAISSILGRRSIMQNLTDISGLVEHRGDMMALLAQVASLGNHDTWVGAGFIRNAVWDRLHGYMQPTPLNDVDVIYFDSEVAEPEAELTRQAELHAICPGTPWSVKNQARMHLSNGDAPYADIADAIRHWPETATTIAVRFLNGKLELLAPYGVDDLVNLIVRPTPCFLAKIDAYRSRLSQKDWTKRWPKLTVFGSDVL